MGNRIQSSIKTEQKKCLVIFVCRGVGRAQKSKLLNTNEKSPPHVNMAFREALKFRIQDIVRKRGAISISDWVCKWKILFFDDFSYSKQDRELNWIAEREHFTKLWPNDSLTYWLTFVFQGIAEWSSAIQKLNEVYWLYGRMRSSWTHPASKRKELELNYS